MLASLILCPSWDPQFPPAGIALLSAELKRAGHDARVFDINRGVYLLEVARDAHFSESQPSPGDPWTELPYVRDQVLPAHRSWIEARLRALLDEGCRFFGFSVYSSNVVFSLEAARMIKRLAPDATVAFGGPGCLTFAECLEHLRHDCVDAVFYGEADVSLPRFMDALEKTGRRRASAGVLLREEPETWKEASDRLPELDALPFADFDAFDSLHGYSGKTLHTTRGCVRRCVFCADWREMPFRTMSGRRIFDEAVHQLGRHPGMRTFLFGDSVLNASLPNLDEFCRLTEAAGLDIVWGGYAIARPDLSGTMLARMRAAGCAELMYGIESGSARVLRAMDKSVPPEINARVLRDTTRAGIKATTPWIVGFPVETDADFEESLEFIRVNAAHIALLAPSLFSIAELKPQARKFGLDPNDSDLFWKTRDGRNTFPVRLERLRRTMETAAAHGVKTAYQGKTSLADLPAYEERLMRLYRA